ncbi:MAG: hypothetical protein HYT61_01495 [Candidatus Yanofskybacteria bacterium]|nr:hypothetical protein [Candidatus Yanofskybacteria bacterium]
MQFKPPKNDDKYQWTNHVKGKMVYYGISESLIKRITRFPKRKEVGIATNTVAVMQSTSNKNKPQEVWVMFQPVGSGRTSNNKSPVFDFKQNKIRIISAWRYPGVSPVGKTVPIPDEILQELSNLIELA